MKRFRTWHLTATLIGLALILASCPAWAQEAKSDGPKFEVTIGNAGEADVQGNKGSVSAVGYGIDASYKDFKLSYERISYSWDQIDRLPFGNGRDDPWSDLQVLRLGYMHNGRINQQWMYMIGGGVSSSFEKQIHDASMGVRAYGAFTYLYSEKLQFTFGGGAGYHKIKSEAIPIVGLSYNTMTPEGFSFSVGFPLTQASYRFNPEWAVRLRAVEYDLDVFQLSDDSTVEPEGYLERQDLKVGLFVDYSPIKNFTVLVGAQYYFLREMTIHNKDDDHEHEYDVDDAWGGLVKLSYSF